MWVPVSSDAVRHLTVQSGIPVPLPDDAVGFLAQRLEVPASDVFHFSAIRKAIGSTTVTLATQSAFRYTGGTDSTAGVLHVGFMLNGSMTIGLGQHPPQRFSPISAYVMPAGVASSVQTTEVTRGLGIQLPQARLIARGIQLEGERLRLERSASLAAPLRVLALAVVEAAWTPTAIGVSVTERTIEDLVVGMFLEGEGYAMDSADLRAGLRMRAVAHIEARHRNRDLSPAVVAAQLGISLRHLQRAFEGGGSTVAAEISRCRAESAAQLLLAPRTAGLTIADIATRSGYTSAFELRAGFRARYGVLPSQYRIGGIALPETRASGRA